MIVDLGYIESAKRRFAQINAENIDNITFVKNGRDFLIDRDAIEKFKLTGLANVDITLCPNLVAK